MVRASPSQLVQIRALLEKLGESLDEEFESGSRGNVRLLQLNGRAASSALDQIEQIWPTMRPNRIRVLSPSSSTIPAFRPGQQWRDRRNESGAEYDGGGRSGLDSLLPLFDQLPSRAPPADDPPPRFLADRATGQPDR